MLVIRNSTAPSRVHLPCSIVPPLVDWLSRVALLPWHLVATATRTLALIHHPDQDWHSLTSSVPISQPCCYNERPSVCHTSAKQWGVSGTDANKL